ncbi:hypothetical protein FY050_04245 [Phyllobacterium endophyticum]|uniref:Hrp-dependent type III effector protein n=1 Tax=Phyllobacterium endophyticum TaxID=1149773 RepID=A0A2P7AR04_9HYPH|nr:hypothetical protein CU100_14945 [Phyllobacterium endophyticum]TYR44348.1 hypothetical protein FY050_04245 [Phyllobacterium endophyticum]
MQQIRLIADDLTGALDSSCAFASEREPIVIGLPWRPIPSGPRIAVSTESRDLTADAAVESVGAMVHKLKLDSSAPAIWFKKVDSVLRGHPVAETQAAFFVGNFSHCVFAPAFPAMGRTTVGGSQFVVTPGGKPSPVGPDLVEAFHGFGLASLVVDFDGLSLNMAAPAVLLVDAADQQTLTSRIAGLSQRLMDRPTLWSGAGGLAAALGGMPLSAKSPPVRYFIVGTNHPASIAQVRVLRKLSLVNEHPANESAPEHPSLFAPALTSTSAAGTNREIRRSVEAININDPQNTAVVVTGGATLSIVLQTVGAVFLECVGEAMAGVPISRVRGGHWEGVTLLSKSGGFGSPQTFAQLLQLSKIGEICSFVYRTAAVSRRRHALDSQPCHLCRRVPGSGGSVETKHLIETFQNCTGRRNCDGRGIFLQPFQPLGAWNGNDRSGP